MAEKTYREFDPWRVSPIREEKREEVLSTHYFDIDRVSLSSTEIGHFERYILRENDGDTICVLPITDNEEVILIEQYRVPNHSWTLELPAGHATEQGQHPEDIAALKLEEEAGYQAQDYAQVCPVCEYPELLNTAYDHLQGYRPGRSPARYSRAGIPLLRSTGDPSG